jgi:hypothetical protein
MIFLYRVVQNCIYFTYFKFSDQKYHSLIVLLQVAAPLSFLRVPGHLNITEILKGLPLFSLTENPRCIRFL